MKSSGLEKDFKKIEHNIIKDINISIIKKELNDTAIKDIINLFRPKKENKSN